MRSDGWEREEKYVSPALSRRCCHPWHFDAVKDVLFLFFSQKSKDTVRKKRDKSSFDRHTPHCRSPLKLRRHHDMNNLWIWQPTRLTDINTATFPCSSVIFSNYLLGAHTVQLLLGSWVNKHYKAISSHIMSSHETVSQTAAVKG